MYWVIYFDEIAESFYSLEKAQEYIESVADSEDGIDDYWIIEGVCVS